MSSKGTTIYQNITGTVSRIQRFAINEGPGIRTEVFFKGCTLRCRWCNSPESIKPTAEIAVSPTKCIGVDVCRECLGACHLADQNPIVVIKGKAARINRHICDNCLSCAAVCPSNALFVFGKKMTVKEVLVEVLADREYYRKEGGVTFSGGEPFVQYNFLKECLTACKHSNIHTCVKTALDIPAEVLIYNLPLIDMIIFDLKVMDAEKHRIFTGKPNHRILENAMLLTETKISMIVRIPVVAGHNNEDENITATARFIKNSLGGSVRQVQLFSYRLLGLKKYEALGKSYPMAHITMPSREAAQQEIERLAGIMSKMGLPAVAGTTTLHAK